MAFIDDTIEVGADIRTVYDAWTSFEDFPAFMEEVETVDLVPVDGLHWVAVVEDDLIEWDADVVEHITDQSVSWAAVDGRETGKVTFEKVSAAMTRVHYQLEYDPKAWEGKADAVRRWMNKRAKADLAAFKAMIEAEA
jgi:uncharacterized membrane protein